ncbi:HD domain-containing protein [Pseudalkalibacillus hwajinpoensis]|uniref:Bifunctional (P)ppGpp synthetase/guanosine-3',5'-bis(Diphosphate) 3'-pyrophosphohydrolase n=1 Tax=Guptibacillus hwajinpoensis TaxID=208199 RepID=A0A4U1MDD1_9BACL|nr:HD domain-containing protein [Pseudalkalibacillus hwajinpoensis]TKD69189.1 bifunctional (p)ppGpp synthetase/guanosine-3',5'-bis(diphosphate) 3'-pyrophosphohydrolase [Pseudalkalibacillus hwajinpoensis]
MKIIERAIELAATAHDRQYRKKSSLPYLSHPVTVGFYLLESGSTEEVVAAGILHDVIEDTALTFANLKDEFGEVVANLVLECSEPDKSLEWEERKLHTIKKLRTASFSVKQITCADKLHNLRTVQRDFAREGSAVWDRFTRGRDKQQWYYDSVYSSLIMNLSSEEACYPLFENLQETILAVFHK